MGWSLERPAPALGRALWGPSSPGHTVGTPPLPAKASNAPPRSPKVQALGGPDRQGLPRKPAVQLGGPHSWGVFPSCARTSTEHPPICPEALVAHGVKAPARTPHRTRSWRFQT